MDSKFVKSGLREKASKILDNYVQYSMEGVDEHTSLVIHVSDAREACIELGEYLIEALIDRKLED